MTNAHDNSIEMDGRMHNIRVMRNMLINSASHPMSTQPSGGGPIYFIRNSASHAPGASSRLTNGSPGLYKASDLDFRLEPGSAAVDRGVVLPTITDGFVGQAPDLGALEVGQPAVVYGPRPQ